jgi:glycosyltransferase involved in cell wall biosynthesis
MVAAVASADPAARIDVYAMVESSEAPHAVSRTSAGSPGGEVVTVSTGNRSLYREAGQAIARSGAEIVWVQHEFGIFGGDAGAWLIDLLRPIAAPIVVTLHTILEAPSLAQRRVMEWLAGRASKMVVMSRHGAEVLMRVYGVDASRIALIPHGAPDRPRGRGAAMKARFGLERRDVLLTFGLLSPNKGLEQAIAALPQIVAAHPDAVYCIAGVTHPKLIEREGEAYRDRLKALAVQLGVHDHVVWIDRYLGTGELLDLIEAADIYLTPYCDAAQSTSGTLTYAVALGKAVISTPYRHAAELLADGLGILVPFGDTEAIGAAVTELLSRPDLLEAIQTRCYVHGRALTWSAFGPSTLKVVDALRTDRSFPAAQMPTGVPRIGLAGLERLCDDTGILQHAALIVPDRNHGYCTDDNARALMLAASAAAPLAARAPVFAAFVEHAWNPSEGRFRNFMGYDRQWREEAGSQDSCGRALWALGVVATEARDPDLRDWAIQLWHRTGELGAQLDSPRAAAFAMLGADALLAAHPDDARAQAIIAAGAARLHLLLANCARPDWQWFEEGLAYDNARLPEALLKGAIRLGNAAMTESAEASAKWLIARQTAPDGRFRPHGTAAFGTALCDPFDQQAVEAWATVDLAAACAAWRPNRRWRIAAEAAFAWFFGANDRGVAVADATSGACRDGVTPHGINRNCGAESVLSLLLAERGLARMGQHAPVDQARRAG